MDSRPTKNRNLDLHQRQYGYSGDQNVVSKHPHLKEPWTSRSVQEGLSHAPDGNVFGAARRGTGIVEDWLVNVSRRGIDTEKSANRLPSSQDKGSDQTPGWRPHGISLQNTVRGGHKRALSRDSSIIPEPMTKIARPPTAANRRGPSHRSLAARVTEVPISTDGSPPRFEKRTRHKIREDRYASQKKPKAKRRRAPEETATRPENVPKKSVSSGREVMNNFQSEAILNDRLTVVGELAYNSMVSVEQPPSREFSWQRQQRLEAKARQRRESELVEISAILRCKETPTTVHPVIGRERPRDGYDDRSTSDEVAQNFPECDDRLSTRSIKRSNALRDDRRHYVHDNTYVAPARHNRPSSRATTYGTWATSGNHQTSLPGDSFDRHHSSTPEPIREALRETGVFNGAGASGNARVSLHDSCQRRKEVHPDEESTKSKASRGRPLIIRYLDKGVMTTDEPSLSPCALEESKSLPGTCDSFAPEGTVDYRARVLVDTTTQKPINEPSGGEINKDSDVESHCKTATSTTRASTAIQAYLVPPLHNLSTQMQATSENIRELQTRTPTIETATEAVAEEGHVRAKRDAEPEYGATAEQSGGKVAAPERSAVPPIPYRQHFSAPNAHNSPRRGANHHFALSEQEPAGNNLYDHLPHEIGRREEALWQQPVFSRPRFLVNQPRKPHALSLPGRKGHSSMTRFNPSQFQPSESVVDFIARVEQEVLGPDSLGYEDNPTDETGNWQYDDRLELRLDISSGSHPLASQDVSINQSLAEPGWRHLEDAFDRIEEEPSENGLNSRETAGEGRKVRQG
ncbi:hypothetical protein BDP55DRAFT_629941 [Colletotrichum godetiae]|uniref:Uncharacterized protein n=1 Tax=Colletotrichum godetiae TaxID=1209918 RepID=A0AAJ0EV41_9PEZI|nr:uncharacterized protein BDP55DRAFT_629941 [Colletotrichum godetiae]KAK1688344.1 hypothetical protein BDP55DRAFT_629941 [Colletotrichum godetiae]